jgi:osmotically-inducible protein OsmY
MMSTMANSAQDGELVNSEPVSSRVDRALQTSGYADLRRLRCESADGVITLRGRVQSFFLKQMAQTVVARVEGVTGINNSLQVT